MASLNARPNAAGSAWPTLFGGGPVRQLPPSAGGYFGVVAAAPAAGIALVFVAAKGYHVALAAGTIARYAAGATLGRPARRGRGRRLYWKTPADRSPHDSGRRLGW
jgi:hypothetical protein